MRNASQLRFDRSIAKIRVLSSRRTMSAIKPLAACLIALMLFACVASPCMAQPSAASRDASGHAEPNNPDTARTKPNLRELWVPAADLPVLLGPETRRMLLTREEFEALKAKAQQESQTENRQPLSDTCLLLAADYEATLESGRAVIRARLKIESLTKGIHALPLLFGGVTLRSATWETKPASVYLASPADQVPPDEFTPPPVASDVHSGPATPNHANSSNVLSNNATANSAGSHTVAGSPSAFSNSVNSQTAVLHFVVEDQGIHTLSLDMVLPVATAAAEQSLMLQLPVPASTRFSMSVPGNVEMKSGPAVASRRVNAERGTTEFELLAVSGPMHLVMSLNNKRLRDETTLLARGVIIDEITQGYERIHASLSINVMHGATDELQIAVPPMYEIIDVTSPLLARWSLRRGEDAAAVNQNANSDATSDQVLTIKLRELVTDRTVINISADRRAQPAAADNASAEPVWFKGWNMPRIRPLNVAGFASVIGVLLEDQLSLSALQSKGLIEIDNQTLTGALPASVLAAQPGMPRVRPVAAFYAPQPDYSLSTNFQRRATQLQVTSSLLLTLDDRGLQVDGGFALKPEFEKLFYIDIQVPAGWRIDQVRLANQTNIPFETHANLDASAANPASDGSEPSINTVRRVRASFPGGIAPGSTENIFFHANLEPANWLANWQEQTIELPKLILINQPDLNETGAIAVRALDDLTVEPESTDGLIVISTHEKAKYGCGDVETQLAWRFGQAQSWRGTLKVKRTTARVTARVLSFYEVTPEQLHLHYELIFDVQQARAEVLRFSLPQNTPSEITIRGLQGVAVKETSNEVSGDRRNWQVRLADKRIGAVRLAVDFNQPLSDAATQSIPLPDARAEDVLYQSGLIALEGHPEIDIVAENHPRAVDIGELVDAEHQPGRRLLGVYSFVGPQEVITAKVARRAIHALPTTIVQRAELLTLADTHGKCQTAARFMLRTKAVYLEIGLPESARLWSIMVDGQPSLPENHNNHIVFSLPASTNMETRNVQIVYEQPISSLGLRGDVQIAGPTLWQREQSDTLRQSVPMADLRWQLVLPAGYQLANSDGTVTQSTAAPSTMTLLKEKIQWLVTLGGGRIAWSSFAPTSRDGSYILSEIQQQEMAMGATAPPSKSDAYPLDIVASSPQAPALPGSAAAPNADQPNGANTSANTSTTTYRQILEGQPNCGEEQERFTSLDPRRPAVPGD